MSRGRGRSSSSRSRGRWNNSSPRRGSSTNHTSRSPPIQCQICSKFGHSASHCWHRLNVSYSPAPPPTPTALHASPAEQQSTWLLDSGATSHVTSTFDNLQQPQQYTDNDQIQVGNGSSIPIQCTGQGLLPLP